jgi:hypothetical protein
LWKRWIHTVKKAILLVYLIKYLSLYKHHWASYYSLILIKIILLNCFFLIIMIQVPLQILLPVLIGGGRLILRFDWAPLVLLMALFLILGASSTRRVSRGRLSGKRKYLMLFPLIVSWSKF